MYPEQVQTLLESARGVCVLPSQNACVSSEQQELAFSAGALGGLVWEGGFVTDVL